MSRRLVAVVVSILLVGGIGLGTGYWIRGDGMRPPVLVADRCDMMGDGSGTCFAGGTAYGRPSSVMWIDSSDTYHDGSAPACLPPASSVARVRIAAGIVRIEGAGWGLVQLVDCRGR